MSRIFVSYIFLFFGLGFISFSNPATAQTIETYPYDLGGFHRAVTTTSPDAQLWFDRGLAWCYGFNHAEAVRCFEYALQEDPKMAMAYWGIAYAWGPNINYTDIPDHQIAQAAIFLRLAELHSRSATQVEKDLIQTLALRYETPVPEDRQPMNEAYADAMREVYKKLPNNSLVSTLFAESLMLLRPWNHWSKDGEPAEETPEIVAVLEKGLEQFPGHPAISHLYIHAMEASPTPEKALPAANSIRESMPDAGHLVHMPSHIDVLVGNYKAVIVANQKAIEADKIYLEQVGYDSPYTTYNAHNFHFLVYGAMFDGQSELALTTAREIKNQIPEQFLKERADSLDAFMAMPLHVLVRFGKWDDILAEPKPADYLPMTRSVWHYARALAYATNNQVKKAEAEQKQFEKAQAAVPESSRLYNNSSKAILDIAYEMMVGEIAYRKGEFDTAFTHLRKAVELDDALNYDEPWAWMQPARHALGALLLEQGKLKEAEAVYRKDLKRHPNNAWALHGLAESLERQGKSEDAMKCRSQFDEAIVRADVKVDRSCFCRVIDLHDAE